MSATVLATITWGMIMTVLIVWALLGAIIVASLALLAGRPMPPVDTSEDG